MENPILDDPTTSPNHYAGFWKRFAALFIDGAIIMFITGGFKWIFMDDIISQSDVDDEWGYGKAAGPDRELYEAIAYYAWAVYILLIRWCYFAGLESSPLKATLGKLAVGLYVTDERGARIDFARATGRHFAKIISGIILGIGYIFAGTSEKKQALHDSMSGCLVMSK